MKEISELQWAVYGLLAAIGVAWWKTETFAVNMWKAIPNIPQKIKREMARVERWYFGE